MLKTETFSDAPVLQMPAALSLVSTKFKGGLQDVFVHGSFVVIIFCDKMAEV